MDKRQYQIIILGGGCAGLWLLQELTTRKYPSVLLEYNSLGAYASTRNQSWLHSGALYAVGAGSGVFPGNNVSRASLVTGRKCVQAFNEMIDFCPSAFERASECLFAFKNHDDLESASQRLALLDIEPKPLGRIELVRKEPAIFGRDAPYRHGLATRDIPFNSHVFLSHLTTEVLQNGGNINRTTRRLEELGITRLSNSWLVEDGKRKLEGQVLICAVGVLAPRMMRIFNVAGAALNVQKSLVLVVHHRVCSRIITLRAAAAGDLNLVPFATGTTVNLSNTDDKADDDKDDHFDEATYAELVEAVGRYVPGLTRGCKAHFYVCQKLNNNHQTSHPRESFGNRHYFWSEDRAQKVHFFYPGKFTLAKLGAHEFAEHLSRIYASQPDLSATRVADDLPVAVPYQGRPTHVLVRRSGSVLAFRRINPQR